MKTNFYFLAIIICTLTGCTLYHPQATPYQPSPATFASAPISQPRLATMRWWESFEDPALNRLMTRCFQGNLDLQVALARLEQVEALERGQNATLWPQVNADGAAGRVRTLGVNNDRYSLSVGASYEIDIWQKLQSRRRAANLTVSASSLDLQGLYLSLAAQLAENYYQVVELQSLLSLNDEIIASFANTVDLVRLRYQHGLVSALDLYQARQNLLAAQAEYPQLKAELGRSQHRLSLLLGIRPGQEELATLVKLPDLHHSFALGLPAQLIQNRPDVQAAFFRLQAADEEIAAAIVERFPSFSLTANYGGQDNILSDILTSPNIFWNLLVNISQPIIDGGSRKSEVVRRQAIFRELAANYHKTVLTAFAEVEDALVNERGADEALKVLTSREQVTGATLRLALEQYQQGITDFLPVLTAQSSNANAKIALIKGQQQRISSRIQLARALGGQWMLAQLPANGSAKNESKK